MNDKFVIGKLALVQSLIHSVSRKRFEICIKNKNWTLPPQHEKMINRYIKGYTTKKNFHSQIVQEIAFLDEITEDKNVISLKKWRESRYGINGVRDKKDCFKKQNLTLGK